MGGWVGRSPKRDGGARRYSFTFDALPTASPRT